MTSLLLTVAFVVAAPAPKDAKADPGRIEGDWLVQSYVLGGNDEGHDKQVVFTFADGRLKVGSEPEMAYRLDPKADPPRIDLIQGTRKQKTIPGIYKFDGDALVICFPHNGDAGRPTTFESPRDTRIVLVTLKRNKKKD
jgi:uncharacterized protein (TIGR03067 family)